MDYNVKVNVFYNLSYNQNKINLFLLKIVDEIQLVNSK